MMLSIGRGMDGVGSCGLATSCGFLLAVCCAFAGGAAGQEMAEVTEAVSNGLDSTARTQLMVWGDDAIPYLRELLAASDNRVSALDIVVALTAIDTIESTKLLIHIAEDMAVPSSFQALEELSDRALLQQHKSQLKASQRLKDVTVQLSSSPMYYMRRTAARIAGRLGWDDLRLILEQLASDPVYVVKVEAVSAMRELGFGDVPPILSREARFPGENMFALAPYVSWPGSRFRVGMRRFVRAASVWAHGMTVRRM